MPLAPHTGALTSMHGPGQLAAPGGRVEDGRSVEQRTEICLYMVRYLAQQKVMLPAHQPQGQTLAPDLWVSVCWATAAANAVSRCIATPVH
jgi:hypothetical protein